MILEASDLDFDAWVRPHLLSMGRLASRLAGDDAADDVVQEALTRAWTKWSTYDPGKGEPISWLLAITADRARRHRLRYRALHPLADRPEVSSDLEGRLDLERAVARLPRKQRLAVELHYFLGLDQATTAEVLGCAVGTVKSQLSDARTRLRTELGDHA